MTVSENVILILSFLLIFNKYEPKFYFYLVVGEATNIKMFLSAEVIFIRSREFKATNQRIST